MAIVQLKPNTNSIQTSYEYTLTQVGAGNSDTIVFPAGLRSGVSMILTVSSGSGKVQFSCTPRSVLLDPTQASTVRWKDWPSGVVSATTDDRCLPVSAIRVVTTSGTQILDVIGE